jgi:hypothetical protein
LTLRTSSCRALSRTVVLLTACLPLAFLVAPRTAAGADPYRAVDEYALRAPRTAEQSIPSLGRYLGRAGKTDREKARAVYRWVTDRIRYDWAASAQSNSSNGAEATLRTRRAVCAGYAALFERLCRQAGVQAVTVIGHARVRGEARGVIGPESGHAWNAVRLGGGWHLVDATWGAGSMNGSTFIKRFRDYYFLAPADQMIFSHFPEDARWQLQSPRLSAAKWQRLPSVDSGLFELGVSTQAVRATLRGRSFSGFVKPFSLPLGKAVLHEAPLGRSLQAGRRVVLLIESAATLEAAVINNGQWQRLQRKGNVYEGTVQPQQGTLRVGLRLPGQGRTYSILLEYAVEAGAAAARPRGIQAADPVSLTARRDGGKR